MSDLKPCPVCKGQSGGIGSDGVENDCMECFKREMKAATPRVEACIDAVMARFTGESKAALARYYEEVHQHLAPLARNLELELAEVKAELARRTQPEATAPTAQIMYQVKLPNSPQSAWFDASEDAYHLTSEGNRRILYSAAPAQDLSAAILAIPLPETCYLGGDEAYGDRVDGYTADQMRDLLKAAAALASSANALSAGDRVDAERYRYLRDHGVPETDAEIEKALTVYQGVGLSSLLPDELDAAIDAAILQSQKDGHD